jgi:hypothetical protein
MAFNVTCPGPVTRRGLIKHSLAASLGYVLGRNYIPSAWAADDMKEKMMKGAGISGGGDGASSGGDTVVAGGPAYVPAKGKCKNVILMWMGGGPSHLDTFDPKPGTPQSGGVGAIEAAPGVTISEKFPMLAKQGRHLCVLKGMTSREGDHGQASHLMHTGYRVQAGVAFPSIGSIVCAEAKGGPTSDLPSYVAINGAGGGPGFYGMSYGPFSVGAGQGITDLKAPMGDKAVDERRQLLGALDQYYSGLNGAPLAVEHKQLYDRAIRLARSPLARLFEIKGDDMPKVAKYGTSGFARACYVAKQLVSKGGVRFVEIDQGGWDTHANVDMATKNLCNQVDQPFARLVEELAAEGLLESTMIMWMGEFGRTPNINAGAGRDHYPRSYSACIVGGGVKGGQQVGKSSEGGQEPVDAVKVPDFFYSICEATGIDPTKIRESQEGRPIQVVDRGAQPLKGIFG